MKTKHKKITVLLVVGLIVPLILNFNINLNNNQKLNEGNLNQSGGYNETSIHVTGATWASTASSNPWCYFDNGVYIIENVTIDASSSPTGSGILIESSSVNFIIRNCTIYNAGTAPSNAGIMLDNVDNGEIYNNTCSNNGRYGMMIYWYCQDIIISENIFFNNQWSGLYFSQHCTNNDIINNICYNNSHSGIYVWNDCNQNNITGNIAYENYDAGIKVQETSHNNIVFNNTIKRNGIGINIQLSDSTTITKNIARENSRRGIYLYSSSENNIIYENTVENNDRYGIEVDSSSNFNNITRNIVNGNRISGIYLQDTSNNNTITNNTINRNDLGILLSSSNYNNISDNIIRDNNWCIFETGCTGNILINNDCTAPTIDETIFIDGAATGVGAKNWTWAESQAWCSGIGTKEAPYIIENLIISGFGINNGIEVRNSDVYFVIQLCQIYNSLSGIYLDEVNNSRLTMNNCSNNIWRGITLHEYCFKNNITQNIATDNDQNGIVIGDHCDNNRIIENTASYNDESGIYLTASGDSSYNNTVSENIVNNNTYGIQLEEAYHFTTISENIISGNTIGIFLKYSDCSNNSIYNNFFLSNEQHAVDDGTDNKWNSTTIGNYWDNHTGPDDNKDGIVDVPYNYIGGTAESIDYLPISDYMASDGLDPGVIVVIVVISVLGGLAMVGAFLAFLVKKGKISLEKLKRFSFRKNILQK